MDDKNETRKELRLFQWQADVALRNAFQDLSSDLGDVVVASASRPGGSDTPIITPQGRLEALTAVDKVLDRLFGKTRGGPSFVADVVAEHTAKAARRVYRKAAADTMVRLPEDLRQAVEKEAKNGPT